MRTFSCVTTDAGATPRLSIILAENEERARELARRELMNAARPATVEISEGGKVLWIEKVGQA